MYGIKFGSFIVIVKGLGIGLIVWAVLCDEGYGFVCCCYDW